MEQLLRQDSFFTSLSAFLYFTFQILCYLHLRTNVFVCSGVRSTFVCYSWIVLCLCICVLSYNCFNTAFMEDSSMWLHVLNCKMILTFPTFFFIPSVLNVVVLSQIWVSIPINTDDLESAYNRTNMNVQLQWGQIKLHRQYMNSLHLVVTSQWSNWVCCDDRWTLAKVWSLIWLTVSMPSVMSLTVNYAWWILEFARLVRSTKWYYLLIWS